MRPIHAPARALSLLIPFALLAWTPAAQEAAAARRPTQGDADLIFVLLKAGTPKEKRTAEESTKLQAAHLANIRKLADEGSLVLAGPFGPGGDPATRGLFVFDVPNIADAERLTETDPAVKAGTLVLEAFPMRATAALRTLGDLEKESAATRPAPASGPAGFQIRAYTYLVADDADRADRALAPLRSARRVCLFGRLGGAMAGKAIVVLDAKDAAAAESLLAPVKSELGAFSMRTWYATPNLTRIHEAAATRASR